MSEDHQDPPAGIPEVQEPTAEQMLDAMLQDQRQQQVAQAAQGADAGLPQANGAPQLLQPPAGMPNAQPAMAPEGGVIPLPAAPGTPPIAPTASGLVPYGQQAPDQLQMQQFVAPCSVTNPLFSPAQLAQFEQLRHGNALFPSRSPTPPGTVVQAPVPLGRLGAAAAQYHSNNNDGVMQMFSDFMRHLWTSQGGGAPPAAAQPQPAAPQRNGTGSAFYTPPTAPLGFAGFAPPPMAPGPPPPPPPPAGHFAPQYGYPMYGGAPPITLREAERVILPPFPQHPQYPQWRYAVTAAIVAASSTDCTYYLAELDDAAIDPSDLIPRDPTLRSLDQKLFAAILHVLRSGDEPMRVAEEIKRDTTLGAGRQAIRILDRHFMHQGTKRRQRSLQELVSLKLNSITDLEDYVAKFERLVYDLSSTDDKVSDSMACSLLRSQLQGHSKLAPSSLSGRSARTLR